MNWSLVVITYKEQSLCCEAEVVRSVEGDIHQTLSAPPSTGSSCELSSGWFWKRALRMEVDNFLQPSISHEQVQSRFLIRVQPPDPNPN